MSEMFKIVQTIEKGMKQLMIIPAPWEHNSQLRWPKLGADKLVKIANSKPEANWFTMNCKLKRNHLITYEIAEEELERMLENDDTEQEEYMNIHQKKRPRVIFSKSKPLELDFNCLVDKCMLPPTVEDEPDNLSSLIETEKENTLLNDDISKFLDNQEMIIQNQKKILEKIEHFSCQEKIMQQLATLMASIDVMAGHQLQCKTVNEKSNLDDILFKPIETLTELEKLEAKLSNKIDMDECIKKFSYVCGRKGSGHGMNNSYILVDKIFSRKFITLCSWAGGARDGKEKIPFKIYKNVIALFFHVVRLSDEDSPMRNFSKL